MNAAAGWRSTQALLAQQAQALLDTLEHELEGRLRAVHEQADAIAAAIGDGRIGLRRNAQLDLFMAGALGATPQVSDIGIVDAAGRSSRWSRAGREALSEDWSAEAEVKEWLAAGRARAGSAWRALLWKPAEHAPSLLHEVPLYRDGVFVGMLGQLVPIAKLSEELALFRAQYEVTPFVLDSADRVLAHPDLAQRRADAHGPFPVLAEFGDPVLARLRAPDGGAPLLGALKRAQAARARVAGRHFVFVYREMAPHRGTPWTVGLYLDPVEGGQRAEMLRVVWSIAAGLAVLLVAVALAAVAGRRVGRPVEALARAAAAVREGRLDDAARLPRSRIAELDDASRSFEEMVAGLRERNLIRDTLGQFVPEQVARELLAGGGRLEPIEAKATVMVCDLEEFAALTDALGARRTIEFLNAYFEVVVAIVEREHGVVTQFQGDAILAVFNVPIAAPDHGANALRAALEIVRAADTQAFAGVRARNRVGLTTGRVVAGAVGSAGRRSYTVHGNAVNLAARLEQMNKEYATRILLSDKTAERCPGFRLRKVADAQIRGYAEPLPVYTPD